MLQQTLDILTSYPSSKRVCVMGNVAVARAAIEAGIRGVFAYPGTPSTEISEVFNYVSSFQINTENQKKYPEQTAGRIYFEYSVNEKIALEKAIAFSIGSRPAMCIMKNVGLNVASDALMTITYQTISAPLLIVVCDDPGCHSSSNEQDSRHWGPMATVPVLNPSTPAMAFEMTKDALKLSGRIKIPVILRMTTRVSHTRNLVSYGEITGDDPNGNFNFIPDHINIPARTAGAHRKLLSKLEDPFAGEIRNKYFLTSSPDKPVTQAIVCSGVAAAYCREIMAVNNLTGQLTLIEIGAIHPFPEQTMSEFIQHGTEKILVLEELDPVVENNIRIVAQKKGSPVKIYGKGFSDLAPAGEYSLDIVSKAMEDFTGKTLNRNGKIQTAEDMIPVTIPPRPPILCAGCPHRATFYLLKLVIPRGQKELVLCGDIGCFGLGALPPLNMIDTIHHMGMSVSMAQGLSAALKLSPYPSPKERGEIPGYHTTDSQMWNLLQEKVLEMRQNPTTAEITLWESLRRNATNFHFRRQHIIDRFIVDFVCLKKGLVVEIDGDIHDYRKEEDETRTQILNERGLKVIRFRNERVLADTHSVVDEIIKQLNNLPDYKLLPFGEDLGGVKKVVALVGDGTFFHSGVASLMNAVYSRSDILVVIFDNRTIGMTGHQDHPGAAHPPRYRELDIASVVKGLGVEQVETINPFNLRDSFVRLQKAMSTTGVSVVIARAPCIFLTELNLKKYAKRRIVIDHERCNVCANHCDLALSCSRNGSAAGNLVRAKAKISAPTQAEGESQLCPANICNHGFFTAVQEGDHPAAVEIVRDKMLFARTCGDICHRPCESRNQGNNGNKIPIRALKKFVSAENENFRNFSIPEQRIKNAKQNGKHIAVIGAGPAGLSAGYDLLQAGYRVTIYEKEDQPGGMVTYAMPSFRMDKRGFLFEATQLERLGAEFRWKKQLGKDMVLPELARQYDAVLMAVGLPNSKKLDIPGKIPPEKCFDALSFLRQFHDGVISIRPGSVILVIGGGNSAMDAARSAKRLSPMNIVMISCLETSPAMPAFPEEVYHAQKDGIVLLNDSFVNRCSMAHAGKIMVELFSWSGNKLLTHIECDTIITAIGQESAAGDYTEFESALVDDSRRIRNNENGYTGIKNIFVAGDVAAGNHMSVIGAIASGKKAATGIRRYLENYPYEYEGSAALEALNSGRIKPYSERHHQPEDMTAIANEYNLYQPCMKCNHCIENFGCPAMIRVNGKVDVDMSKCTLCGFCIDVCPNDAIRWEMA